MSLTTNDLSAFIRFCASDRGLYIVRGRYRIDNPIPPDIRPQFCERESRIQFHDPLAKAGAGLSSPARTQVQVADCHPEVSREFFALWRLRYLEVGFEVHPPTIDHFDLFEQIFLLVDQNDRRGYPDNYENL